MANTDSGSTPTWLIRAGPILPPVRSAKIAISVAATKPIPTPKATAAEVAEAYLNLSSAVWGLISKVAANEASSGIITKTIKRLVALVGKAANIGSGGSGPNSTASGETADPCPRLNPTPVSQLIT